jgi:hypothetical protein
MVTAAIERCLKCKQPCCQCDLCKKTKGHSGLCAACHRSHVETSAPGAKIVGQVGQNKVNTCK